jgi:hypothetical protein
MNFTSGLWRSTFQTLRQDFHQAAESFPTLRHAILQALDEEGTIPPNLEREMRKAGGWSDGELRSRWELKEAAKDPSNSPYLDSLALDLPAKRGYLFGESAARSKFERLAERAWLALPGSTAGKAQAYPQPRIVDRWLAFVYARLQGTASSYLSPYEELWVCDYNKRGRRVEHRFAPRLVKEGDMVSTGYPDAVRLSRRAKRWIHTALATNPFAASTVAIDLLLGDPDKEGHHIVSEEEYNALDQRSAAIDYIQLGQQRIFWIYRDWCKPVQGSEPSICPNADPPADKADHAGLLSFMPAIEKRCRELNLIGVGQTIHWVGEQARLGTVCTCFRSEVPGSTPGGKGHAPESSTAGIGEAFKGSDADRPTTIQAKPVWNKDARELRWGNVLIRRYKKHPAPNQVKILDAFQAAGWAATIENPFHVRERLNVENRTVELKTLGDAVRSLNNGMLVKVIKFELNGANRCEWRKV